MVLLSLRQRELKVKKSKFKAVLHKNKVQKELFEKVKKLSHEEEIKFYEAEVLKSDFSEQYLILFRNGISDYHDIPKNSCGLS